jgi:putative ABC transport system permease protein
MSKRGIHPPSLARKMLSSFLRRDFAEDVVGDLDEKFYSILKNRSAFIARLNYWFQVFNYLRPFAIRRSKNSLTPFIMYSSYFKIGWRNLSRNKGYSTINISSLACAMVVAIFIGLWISDELSFNKIHSNYETIARVHRKELWGDTREVNTSHVTGLGTLLRNEYGAYFKHVVMVRARLEERVISFADKKLTQEGYFMQPEGVEMFSLEMIQGSSDALKDMKSVILSESTAKKLFGDNDPIDQMVSMDAKWDLKVTGVYRDLPKNSEFGDATFFAPLDLYLDKWATLTAWDNYHMIIYAQIHPDGDFENISSVIKDITLPHVNEETRASKPEIFLHPMSKWHLYSQWENGVEVTSERMKFVWFYGAIGVFVLILACINFMNLSTARSEKRSKEVGIRKTIGSYRTQLIHQFYGESFLVSLIAFAVCLAFVTLLLPWFNEIADKSIRLPFASYTFWLATGVFVLFTTLLAGSYPALYLSSFNPIAALKGRVKKGGVSARRVLVVVQFTVSVSLVAGTAVVYKQIQYVKDRPVGYVRDGLVTIRPKSPEYHGKYEVLRNEFKKTGVVDEIAEANYPVTNALGWNGGFTWEGMPQGFDQSFNTIFVTHEYGKTVGWEVVNGRDFSRDVASDENAIILNESAVKLMQLQNPVGTVMTWDTEWRGSSTHTVVGVVKDMVKGSPYEPTDPSVIFVSPKDQEWLFIRLRKGVNAGEALPKIQSVFASIVPSAPFDYKFADDDYATKFKSEEQVGKLSGAFTFLAILISCSGLFGLALFVAEQRRKEIGIRKVLGASVIRLLGMLSREFVILVGIACLIAVPLSYQFMSSWLVQYQYRTELTWMLFVWIVGGAIAITMLTVLFQALKAALSNPVESIRTE